MRKPTLSNNIIYHIYNRGIAKRTLFRNNQDYRYFMRQIDRFKQQYNIKITIFCLMPNHFHFLLRTNKNGSQISKFMKSLQQSYAIVFNKKYKKSGYVFESRFKNKLVKDQLYLAKLIQYIAENPVKKKLVKTVAEWPYSG